MNESTTPLRLPRGDHDEISLTSRSEHFNAANCRGSSGVEHMIRTDRSGAVGRLPLRDVELQTLIPRDVDLDEQSAARMSAEQRVWQKFRASGINVRSWALERGFNPGLVYSVLRGERKCLRGQSHDVAIALGLKS